MIAPAEEFDIEAIKACDHDMKFVRHIRRGLHECLACGHRSYLKGRPYFCNSCPGVHSLTFAEMQEHRKKFHPPLRNADD